MNRIHTLCAAAMGTVLAVLALALGEGPARADDVAPTDSKPAHAGRLLEEPPLYGTFYDAYEPTFYTGFAPRADDPRRVHLHVGRGNQLRITLVLSDETIRAYSRDLRARDETYRALLDQKRLRLSQNDAYAKFEEVIDQIDLEDLIEDEEEGDLSPEALRARNLDLLERLNPGRIHRIEISEDALIRQWGARLSPADRQTMDRARQLELLNALLPTRLWLAEAGAGLKKELAALVRKAPEDPAAPVAEPFREAWLALFDRVTGGLYPRAAGSVVFVEFTAIHPIGTFNEYVEFHGRKIPLYPTPGRRALTTHQRTKTVDHIPTVGVYSYSPWIPYMHVGTKLHNSFHTLWWRMYPEQTAFLPDEWKQSSRAQNGDKPHTHLWLLSRGPMSSGCTHLTTGHINEFRQVLPSDTTKIYEIDTFLNRSYNYDVFDIDGDLEPEVMGVRYFIAYSLRNKKPNRLRVRNERRAYYDWLYAGELEYDEDGNGFFAEVHDGRFIERTAKQGLPYRNIRLYEAKYEPETFQFYRMVDIGFAREMRKVGASHAFGSTPPGTR